MDYDYDLVVIGSGPGGYVAAIRASQLGLKTAVVEMGRPGGVCLNIGCIPSKALIHQAEVFRNISGAASLGIKVDMSGFNYGAVFKKSREAAERLSRGVQFLLKKNNVALIEGKAAFEGPHVLSVVQPKGGELRSVSGRHILIATGSRSKNIPGFPVDEKRVLSSAGALMLERLPRKAVILGAGAIGMEFAYIWGSFGVEVTVVEMLDRVLPLEDEEVSLAVAAAFKKAGTVILTGAAAKGLSMGKDSVSVSVAEQDGTEKVLEADLVLVAVGRTPNTEELNLERVGIETVRGFIPVGEYYMTAVEGIYACGDVVASPLLAHVASKEGEIAVCRMAEKKPSQNSILCLFPRACTAGLRWGVSASLSGRRRGGASPLKRPSSPTGASGRPWLSRRATGS